MFGFDWSEIAVIAVVALICIGPKDMPVAIRAITATIKKMRRMAGEFQGHVDEMLKEADLQEVSTTLRDLRGLSVRGAIGRAIDPDGSINRAMSDPFLDRPVPPAGQPGGDALPEQTLADRFSQPASLSGPPPAFLPPGSRPPAPIQPPPQAPDFLPPRHGPTEAEPPHAVAPAVMRAQPPPADRDAVASSPHADDF